MRIYNKHRKGTDNLSIIAMINKRVWGVKLDKEQILRMVESFIRENHNGEIEVLDISTKERN
jgi:hypothetical protein